MKIKIHNSYRNVVAICDSSILGKKFEQGKKQLHIKKGFFGGDEINEKKLIKKIKTLDKEDATFNIAGENSIQAAIKAKIINKKGVKKIQNIPFALVLL